MRSTATRATENGRYNDEELNEFRLLIEEKRDQAQKQLELYLDQIRGLADNDDLKLKGLDDSIGTVETERLYTLAARQRKHIQHLENALIRIKNKTYGICRASGKLISKERLKAVPHATMSIEAKERRAPRRRR